ncbi:MAG: YdeI/OmpD-associated family protein [Anaerolineales bacterium]|nr:YdeI/OmpD-associated family protein [Anaerolineales bacterium]MCW5855778.1 YdeI/OmpD-associated family protein [Anaerolineales bacterium]
MNPIFFGSPAEFRDWLQVNHASTGEVFVGYYKAGSSQRGITHSQAIEEALCYGWIDSVGKSIDGERYAVRFSPRRPDSVWSQRNLGIVEALIASGRMQSAGLAAYQARRADKTGTYSFEQAEITLDPQLEKRFKANRAAWEFFTTQPPGYQKAMRHWVNSAKREETQLKRLARLIEVSAQAQRIDDRHPFGKK